jgi:zinc/manganese transport system substrate-binding protein
MRSFTICIAIIAATICAEGKLAVVTTTTDLADFARQIGGDRVSVVSLSRGDQDPHAVEPRPSMVMKVKNADILIRIGMDLDLWVDGLIDASRNGKIKKGVRGYLDKGTHGYLDVSESIEKLEVPEGKVDGSMGDIHIYGNPHYWTSPENAGLIGDLICERMSELRPGDAGYFKQNHEQYTKKLHEAFEHWKRILQPFVKSGIVTYHNSWPYFARSFDLTIAGYVEPKPGIPPTPSHITELVQTMKSAGVRVIIMEPWFNLKTAQSIAQKAAAKVVVLSPSVGGVKGTDSYIGLMSYNVKLLAATLNSPGDTP